MGNVVEVDLEKKSQRTQPILLLCVVGHTSFYAKMDLAKFGVLYKDRAPRSDPSKTRLIVKNKRRRCRL